MGFLGGIAQLASQFEKLLLLRCAFIKFECICLMADIGLFIIHEAGSISSPDPCNERAGRSVGVFSDIPGVIVAGLLSALPK